MSSLSISTYTSTYNFRQRADLRKNPVRAIQIATETKSLKQINQIDNEKVFPSKSVYSDTSFVLQLQVGMAPLLLNGEAVTHTNINDSLSLDI